MKSRRMIGLLAIAIAGTVAVPAQAAPTPTPFLPMALITVTRGSSTIAIAPVSIFFPAEWSCWNSNPQDPYNIDITCVPPAAPPGTTNWCAWVASFSQADGNNESAPSATSYCGDAAATSGRGSLAAVTTANTQLTALRCRVNLTAVPPNVGVRAGCTTNH